MGMEYDNKTLFWTIVAAFAGLIFVMVALISGSVQTTQSIRDEIANQNASVLHQIKLDLNQSKHSWR